MQTSRPLGVTIISILMIISGIVSIVSGLIGVVGALSLSTISPQSDVATLSIGLMGVSIFIIILGVATLAIAWGLLKGKRWAWIITVIISIISILLSIIGIAMGGYYQVITLILYGVILYYLYKTDVKTYFGKIKIST
jgi:lysylphosphatidylglycerol synthetase-like protein (DUF2156 family)